MQTYNMPKSFMRFLGLDGEWTKPKLIRFLRDQKIVPYWRDEELIFRPARFGRETKKQVQRILRIQNREDVESLRLELLEKKASK